MFKGGLAWGATNSGKSVSNASHFAKACAKWTGKHMLVGVNLKLLRAEIIPLIRSIAKSYGISSTPYRTDTGTMTIGNSLVFVIAGRNEGDEDRLRSIHGILTIMFEEVAGGMPEYFFDMALSRRDQRFNGPFWASCNPSHPDNWVKKRLDSKWWPHDEMFLVGDNPTLTDEQRDEFESKFTGLFRKRMIEALWASPLGLIYPRWESITTEEADALKGKPCYIGADYGESRITAANYSQWASEDRYWATTKNYYWDNYTQDEQRDPLQHALAIKQFAPGPIAGAYVDPSALPLIEAMRKVGIPAEPAYNKKDGYNITDGMFQQGQLRICEDYCEELVIEIRSLVYNKYGDAPDLKCSDHATDAERYKACALSEVMVATTPKTVYRRG